jgi:hypothetical protein
MEDVSFVEFVAHIREEAGLQDVCVRASFSPECRGVGAVVSRPMYGFVIPVFYVG